MNDELLMRFIDGTATPKEVETVVEMLSKDDEAAKEWIQMEQAARLADSRPAVEVSEGKASEFITSALKENKTESKVKSLPWILGSVVAAAAAVAMFVLLPIFQEKSGPDEYVAEIPEDPSELVVPVDSALVEPMQPEAMEYVAEVVDRKPEQKPEQELEQIQPQAGEMVEAEAHRSDVSTAAGMKACPAFRMIRPAKTPYRVRVNDVNKEFVFEWETTEAVSVELIVSDSSGNVIVDEMIEGEICQCPVKAYEITNRGELVWNIKVSYENGFKHVESGKIELVNLQ